MLSGPKLSCSKPLKYIALFNPYNGLLVTIFVGGKEIEVQRVKYLILFKGLKPSLLDCQVPCPLPPCCSLIDIPHGTSFCLLSMALILFPLNTRGVRPISRNGEKFKTWFRYPPILRRTGSLYVSASKSPVFLFAGRAHREHRASPECARETQPLASLCHICVPDGEKTHREKQS